MLVLSRKRTESIVVGDNVRITVLKIERNAVRLGIEAPREISVVREELALDPEHRAARAAWDEQPDPRPATATRGT
jgi:carbon storage regulator